MRAEIVATGIPFGEGPVWCPDGTLVVTSVTAGALFRIHPSEQRAERFAETAGGANGAALTADGSILVTQNGGFDVQTDFVRGAPAVTSEPATPGLQLATADGRVTYLYATDAIPGNVVAWEHMPTPGLPLATWPGLARA